jgi:hypothetical protein
MRSNDAKYSDAPLEAMFRETIRGLSLMAVDDPVQRLACQVACIGFYAGRLYERQGDPRSDYWAKISQQAPPAKDVPCRHRHQTADAHEVVGTPTPWFCDDCGAPC